MSTNVSKKKREKLVEKIKAIKTYIATAEQDENTAQLLTYIAEIEKDIKGKKYGLVFEEHRESIDETLENKLPVLVEDESLFIDNGGQMNFLIEGDNLASLKLLEKTHKGKIDLIYIDPPYNTGHEFVYDDTFVGTEDSYRHSKWISFMQKRLNVAKNLLSDDGVIIISIDDNEQANLRLLCDSIFDNNNFIGTIIHQRAKGGGQAKHIVKGHDYIHIYSKNIAKVSLSRKKEIEITPKMKLIEGKYYIKNDDVIRKSFGKYDKSMDRRCFYEELIQYKGEKKKQQVDEKLAKGEYFLEERNGMHVICEYLPVEGARAKLYSIIKVLSEEGKKELDELGITTFSYPKPVDLIQQLCDINNDKYSTILDFFAGSGTTGHAVMKLNAEDGGQRKFILCTNNENNICREVTYERIKRVIDKENYSASLKYFKVDFVPISDKLYYEYADELLKHVKELVELENAINFNGNDKIAIILTEEELDGFANAIPETCKTVYLGHDVLPSETQEKIFKKNGITINIIPDYYYRDLEA